MALLAQYLFKDNADDELGNYNGAATGVTFETAPKDMSIGGKAAIFDGSNNSYITLPATTMFNSTWTVECWAQVTGRISQSRAILGQGVNSKCRWIYCGYHNTNKLINSFYEDDTQTSTTYSDYNWHHLVFQYQTSNRQRRIFRDGDNVATGTASGALNITSANWYIGNFPTYSRPFQGKIANFRVWSEYLSAATILEHYRTESLPPPDASYRLVPRRSRELGYVLQQTR